MRRGEGVPDITNDEISGVEMVDITRHLDSPERVEEGGVAVLDLGRRPYEPVWRLQHELVRRRKEGGVGDVLLMVEHEPVITLGRSGDGSNIIASEAQLRRLGVEVYRVERGGDVTYHGPGQLVGYPILDLRGHRKDVGWYVRTLEEVLIRSLAEFGIEGQRDPGNVGVWVEGKKIAAIGARIEEWVTYHGFALNVDPDLSYFDLIVPCGIAHRSVTSMAQARGAGPSLAEVRGVVEQVFCDLFPQSRFMGEPS